MPLDIDRFAHVESSLQRWDPRVKIAALGVFVFSVALVKTIPFAILALLIAIAFIKLSSLPYDFVAHALKFVLFFLIPFFFIMPLTYPGEAAFYFLGIPFAWEGLRIATLVFIKAIAIVLTSFVMFGTARFDVSMIALQKLKCPKIMVQLLLFTYRYVFVFIEEMRSMQTSMRVRGFVPRTNMYTLKTMGHFVGTLLVRSYERTERVYKAMLSKGYEGEFHTLTTFKSERNDFVKAGIVSFVTVALFVGDLSGLFTPAKLGWF